MSKVEKNEANLDKCACPNCPSHNECAKEKMEKLYCSEEVGKSTCPFEMKGCLCGPCPVHTENDLKSGYYCINGTSSDKTIM